MTQKGLAPILIVLLIAVAIGGYLIYQKQAKPVVMPQSVTKSLPSPIVTPIASNSAEIVFIESTQNATWKTYKAQDFMFMYPPNYSVSKDGGIYQVFRVYPSFVHTLVRINTESDVNEAKRLAQNEITSDLEIKNMNNGIQITGKAPGYVKATTVSVALFYYKNGAVKFEFRGSGYKDTSFELFNQILSTFKFIQ